MKILFLLGGGETSPEKKLAEETGKLIGKDADVEFYDGSVPVSALPEPDGIWIFTHEEDGRCPSALMDDIRDFFPRLTDVPVIASGIGGKDGAMNAVAEIADFIIEFDGRYMTDSEPLCIPLRTARFDELEPEERMDLFFLVDSFLKYCGMDDSESRKIAFGTVVNNYFRIMKYLSPDGPKPTDVRLCGTVIETDVGPFDCTLSEDAPAELSELRYETETLISDFEIDASEIRSALLEKILREW